MPHHTGEVRPKRPTPKPQRPSVVDGASGRGGAPTLHTVYYYTNKNCIMLRAIVRASELRPVRQLSSMMRQAGRECFSQPAQSQARTVHSSFADLRGCCSSAWQRTPHRRWQQQQWGRAIPLAAQQHYTLTAVRSKRTHAAVSQPAFADFQSDFPSDSGPDSQRCILPELAEDMADSFGDTLLCFGATAVRCLPSALHTSLAHWAT